MMTRLGTWRRTLGSYGGIVQVVGVLPFVIVCSWDRFTDPASAIFGLVEGVLLYAIGIMIGRYFWPYVENMKGDREVVDGR